MIHTLENDLISIEIKQLGAELCSYFDKETNREIVWQGDPNFWKRHAPILFPIIGKVENNEYRLESKAFSLSQHGFARDQEYQLVEQTSNKVILEIKNTEQSLSVFPFEFKLQVEYTLNNKELQVLYRVINPSNENIYFCLGAHPGFNVPFDANSTFSDYQLKFEKEEASDRLLLTPEGFRSGKRAKQWLTGDVINLNFDLFKDDALIFDDLKSSNLFIESEKSNESVKVGWHNYPHMGIWNPLNDAPFLCIEPWNGMADEAGLNNDFKEKYGVVILESNKTFECFYTIENLTK